MGRIRDHIEVDGRKLWTLFDSGARNTYVVREAAKDLTMWSLPRPESASLGGGLHRITHVCALIGTVRGLWVHTHARIIDTLGNDEQGRPIEILFGALAMQE